MVTALTCAQSVGGVRLFTDGPLNSQMYTLSSSNQPGKQEEALGKAGSGDSPARATV